MFKNVLNLRNVVAVAISLAVSVTFSGCGKDNGGNKDEDDSVGKGTGKIELKGKDYPLNESFIATYSQNPPLSSLQFQYNDDETKKIVITMSNVTNSSFPANTYTNDVILIQMSYDDTNAAEDYDDNREMLSEMVVKKDGDNYDIKLSGKVSLLGTQVEIADITVTYTGKIGGMQK